MKTREADTTIVRAACDGSITEFHFADGDVCRIQRGAGCLMPAAWERLNEPSIPAPEEADAPEPDCPVQILTWFPPEGLCPFCGFNDWRQFRDAQGFADECRNCGEVER